MGLSDLLGDTILREKPSLQAVSEERAARPRGPGKWSPKEELGHLCDSAANNHLRFAGGASLPEYRGPGYAQEEWVRMHRYREMAWDEIVSFWFQYNSLLARLIAGIPADKLKTMCTVGDGAPVTLEVLIEDYIVHMQHHLDLLLLRESVTKYPRS